MVIIFSFAPSFKNSQNFNIQNTVSSRMKLGVGGYVDTEKRFCFKISESENLFGNWCPVHSIQFICSILLPELVTQNLLYTNRHNNLAYLYSTMKKRYTLRNSAFGHQTVPHDFLNHAQICQCIYQQQDTECYLHVRDIDIYVSVDDLRDIFGFCHFNALNTPFHKLHINFCFYYVIYDVINIFHGSVSLGCKKKQSIFHQHHLPVPTITDCHFLLSELRQHAIMFLLK